MPTTPSDVLSLLIDYQPVKSFLETTACIMSNHLLYVSVQLCANNIGFETYGYKPQNLLPGMIRMLQYTVNSAYHVITNPFY